MPTQRYAILAKANTTVIGKSTKIALRMELFFNI